MFIRRFNHRFRHPTPSPPGLRSAPSAALFLFAAAALASRIPTPAVGAPLVAADPNTLWIVQPGVPLPRGGLGTRLLHTPLDRPFKVPRRYAVRRGEILRAIVLAGNLHAFFSDGSYWSFAPNRNTQELKLPGAVIPIAIAADPLHNALLAIVPDRIVRRIARDNARRDRAFADPDAPPDSQPPVASAPAFDSLIGASHLVRYARRRWLPLEPLPDFIDLAGLAWMATDGEDVALVWRPPGAAPRRDLRVARRTAGEWDPPESIPRTADLLRVALRIIDGREVLAGIRPDESDSGTANLVLLQRRNDTWEITVLRDAEGASLTVLSSRAAAFPFADGAFVVAADPDRALQFGMWRPDGTAPPEGLSKIPIIQIDSNGPKSGKWAELGGYFLLIILVTALFLRRQESLLHAAKLAPGLAPAGLARRAAGMLLDILPAAAVTVPFWLHPMNDIMMAYSDSIADPSVAPVGRGALWLPFLFPRVVYTAYCGAWELWRGATPGKMAVRTSLCATSGGPCSPRQIILRNLLRLIETEPILMIWPLLMLVLITRNRQRLGDVWARTVVVQGTPTPLSAPDSNPPQDPDD